MEMGRKQRKITSESSGGRRKSLRDLRVQSGFVVQSGAAVLFSLTLAGGEQPQPRLISSAHEVHMKSEAELKRTKIVATALCLNHRTSCSHQSGSSICSFNDCLISNCSLLTSWTLRSASLPESCGSWSRK